MSAQKFWLYNLNELFKLEFFPTTQMTETERLNAITRLIIVIYIILLICDVPFSLAFLILGLFLVILKNSAQQVECFSPHRGNPVCGNCINSTLPYINTKYERTPVDNLSFVNYGLNSYNTAKYQVTPLYVPQAYSEVWRNEPRYCNEFTQTPASYTMISDIYDEDRAFPSTKCSFDDNQWVTYTNSDSYSPPKRVSAMPAVQSAFMRDSLEYRNAIMGEYVDQFERQRQHNCTEFKPGRKTF